MLNYQRIRRVIAQSQFRDLLLKYRHRGLRDTDVFLASYPRSGSNWVKFLLLESITDMPIDFYQSDVLMPYVGEHFHAPFLLPGNKRFLKTHERYRDEYKKAIYLVRDPRAVIVSEYKQHRDLKKYTESFEQFIIDFVKGKVNGFGSWAAHVRSWLEADPSTVLIVKFEDLRADPVKSVFEILYFLGVKPLPGAVERAVSNNTIERMREKENQARLHVSHSKMIKNLKGDSRFVNEGAVQSWVNTLDEKQICMIEQHAGELLNQLGYDARFLHKSK